MEEIGVPLRMRILASSQKKEISSMNPTQFPADVLTLSVQSEGVIFKVLKIMELLIMILRQTCSGNC